MVKSVSTQQQERLVALLRQARKQAGLTQDELAERMGAYKTFVSKYERGERRLDVIEFLAVTDALGLEPAAVLASLTSAPARPKR